jgi:trehalose 6-phosphate synthase/phosphatase
MANKVVIVSNRLPVSIKKKRDKYVFERTVGGVASVLDKTQQTQNTKWVGWPGTYLHGGNGKIEKEVRVSLIRKFKYYPVFQSQSDIENYYYGYSNSTLWPLFHYFTQNAIYDRRFWRAYVRVNKLFCDEIIKIAGPEDMIWIHDYHLMLLPQLIREKIPDATIGFFLHTPFPSFEIFRLLPQRVEILKGLLGADVVGFQTYEYTRHFLDSVYRLLGCEHSLGQIKDVERLVKADAFPIGIDFEKYNQAASNEGVQKEIAKLRKKIGDRKVIFSVDRLDYTKGIPQRLEAFSNFLERYPKYKEKVILILVAVPTRTKIEEYSIMKKQIDELIGNINGKYGNLDWTPVWYLYKGLDFPQLAALYGVADVALVTPIRDGMNLIAKEYVVTKSEGEGVLVLSEMAGAAEELGEALIINPNSDREIVEALKKALTMPKEEQIRRNKAMQGELKRFDEKKWSKNFMERLSETKKLQKQMQEKILTKKMESKLIGDYRKSKKRLLLLDYDGTLVSFAKTPEEASPDSELIKLLRGLAKDARNKIVIISGRDKDTLDLWFGDLNVGLAAEHGVWIREVGTEWKMIENLTADWKKEIRPILDKYVERTPGSFVEEKGYSLVWHYRKSDLALGPIRKRELVGVLDDITSSFNLQILEGNKVIEIKSASVNKGRMASHWLSRGGWDFILALGDDTTDEDMFSVLTEKAYSIKVGIGQTQARFNLKLMKDGRQLLKEVKG